MQHPRRYCELDRGRVRQVELQQAPIADPGWKGERGGDEWQEWTTDRQKNRHLGLLYANLKVETQRSPGLDLHLRKLLGQGRQL